MEEKDPLVLGDFSVSSERGFLPEEDPLTVMPPGWEYLDDFGNNLPELIESGKILTQAKLLPIPPDFRFSLLSERELQLAWIRYSFIQSAYVHSQKTGPFSVCKNIAKPLVAISKILKVRPILPYFAYTLNNWKRKDPDGPIKVDNLQLIQTFIRDSDQSWFNLIHVDIEYEYGLGVRNLWNAQFFVEMGDANGLELSIFHVTKSIKNMIAVMKRMPEGTHPDTYYKIRPWIMFFENVIYEGVEEFEGKPQTFPGQTGAQTSIFQSLEAGLQMPKLEESRLAVHLMDMRNHMPEGHRKFIEYLEANSRVRDFIVSSAPDLVELYDECIDQELTFLAIHLGYAFYYIHKQTDNPRGTGMTKDFMDYLGSRIKERWERAFIKPRSENDFKLFKTNVGKMVKELVAA
ncbi:MAG: hypothetical protein Q7S43_00880 [bacterium]|nr:hypothetical protein [bacterium]